jgi:hypothetical protein
MASPSSLTVATTEILIYIDFLQYAALQPAYYAIIYLVYSRTDESGGTCKPVPFQRYPELEHLFFGHTFSVPFLTPTSESRYTFPDCFQELVPDIAGRMGR